MHLTQGLTWVSWNIFLALIPVAMAYAVQELIILPGTRGRWLVKTLIFLAGFAWLAFLPNTCYLLTEWRHFLESLGYTEIQNRWQTDSNAALELMLLTFFYLCYSGVGMLTFTLALRPITRLLRRESIAVWICEVPFFLMMSVGVYLGLILRYNSWDLISRPSEVWTTVSELWSRPTVVLFIILFAGFLRLAYEVTDIWIDGLVCRWLTIRGRQLHNVDE